MKRILLLSVLVSIALYSCADQPYIYVEKNLSHRKTLVYDFNSTGTVNNSVNVSSRDIVRALTDDIQNGIDKFGFTVKELSVQSIDLKLIQNSGNAAISMDLAATISKPNPTGPPIVLLKRNNLSINQFTIALANNILAFDGVDTINKDLSEALKDLNYRGFLIVQVNGNSVPAGSRASAKLEMTITFNMQYSYCEESLGFIDGSVCID